MKLMQKKNLPLRWVYIVVDTVEQAQRRGWANFEWTRLRRAQFFCLHVLRCQLKDSYQFGKKPLRHSERNWHMFSVQQSTISVRSLTLWLSVKMPPKKPIPDGKRQKSEETAEITHRSIMCIDRIHNWTPIRSSTLFVHCLRKCARSS